MEPAVRRIGSGAGATMSWKAYMKLSRTAVGPFWRGPDSAFSDTGDCPGSFTDSDDSSLSVHFSAILLDGLHRSQVIHYIELTILLVGLPGQVIGNLVVCVGIVFAALAVFWSG